MFDLKATQEEIDFMFGAIDWKYEGFPTNYDGSVEVEVDFASFIDLVWGDLHNAKRVGVSPENYYVGGEVSYDLVPLRFMGIYKISPEGTRTFESWYHEQ